MSPDAGAIVATMDQTVPQAISGAENKTPVTGALVDLGIPLKPGTNHPAPGLTMELYAKVDGHITIETEIIVQEDEAPHPLVAKMLAMIGYEKTDCGYFWCTEPKVSKSDAFTTTVSVKKPYRRFSPHEVHIILRTLLDEQLIHQYLAILRAKKAPKK
jgi:hypothetical protein